MPYYVYIVKCRDGMYYTGITWNLKKRIEQHNKGILTMIQPKRRPVTLVYSEMHINRTNAPKREKEIKGWNRKKKERLITVYAEERSDEAGTSSVG